MHPLRKKHIETLSRVLAIRALADTLDDVDKETVVLGLEETLHFLNIEFESETLAAEKVLYPEASRISGDDTVERFMVRQHAEIRSLCERLVALHQQLNIVDLRRVLHGLDHSLRMHVANEEELVLPQLASAMNTEQLEHVIAQTMRMATKLRHPSARNDQMLEAS